MKWYENHRHNWSYCHDLRFWISFYFLCGWEALEYGEIPPFCVYAICLMRSKRSCNKRSNVLFEKTIHHRRCVASNNEKNNEVVKIMLGVGVGQELLSLRHHRVMRDIPSTLSLVNHFLSRREDYVNISR